MKMKATPKRQMKKAGKAARRESSALSTGGSFPIVGIGASAGGLEALEQFLGRVPTGSGVAFVIVQHLDPTHKGIMAELLQRCTGMTVVQVKDRTRVRPDCVYVIPPNKDMSILHGILHLLEPTAPRGLRLPIDSFLRSLAQDRQEHSIGVILSGMGSDGTLGLRAIKEKAGVALVQEPSSAKFDGMPRSAIEAGLADIVAPADELPAKILAYLQNKPLVARTDVVLESKAQSALEKAVILLRAHMGAEARSAPKQVANLQSLADQLILHRYAPPSVLANDKGDILYISGRTGKYLEPAAGKANWNVFAMVREGLRYELTDAFQKALRQKERVMLHGLKEGTNGDTQHVDVTVQRLDEPGSLQGLVMIVFVDVAAVAKVAGRLSKSHAGGTRLAELEQEILHVRGEARANQEEMQTSQEELRSANEELTTSKEEMQSMNEELQTLNTELQSKLDELSRASNDMKNLLDSTDIATLFLDRDLKVRRFTPQATKIIKLIPGDVGRPITDLATELRYPQLAADARDVLRTLVSVEKSIGTLGRRWFTVRIMPYRTLDDRIDGVVITFADITVAKTLEAKLRDNQSVLESHVAKQNVKLERRKKTSQAAPLEPLTKKPRHAK